MGRGYIEGKKKHPYTERGLELFSRLNSIGRTQAWLARELNVSGAYISNVMRGIKPWSEDFEIKINTAIRKERKTRGENYETTNHQELTG